MNNNRWASFPRWIGETLTEFTAGKDAGAHMAALRVYLAIALESDFDTRIATISWSALEKSTGLSRPMVKKGIVTAEKAGLIAVDKSGHTHSYRQLAQTDEIAFTQVPFFDLKSALPKLPTRGFHALDALKVYLTLLTVRLRNSELAVISHKKIQIRSGIQPGRIRAAIDVLINHRLIHVITVDAMETGSHRHNEYHLIGFKTAQPTPPSSSAAQVIATPPVAVRPNPSFLLLPSRHDDLPF